MAKYEAKPVIIDAVQFDGSNYREIEEFAGDVGRVIRRGERVQVLTLQGRVTGSPGDYVVRGVQDECSAYKPEVFEATYEPVGEDG